ncbi:MAG TPA: hypothetical protein VJR89_01535 [Polyangiales bacterium]|nr:hypothetical protein [Polyangiales bacterium]
MLAAFGKIKADSLAGSLLLVGGRDYRSLNVRNAQTGLRYDRRSSYWSHAAVLTKWNAENPARSTGLEVALDPSDPIAQVPERNGVTAFQLRKYLDERLYPNLALIHIALKDMPGEENGKRIVAHSAGARREAAVTAARNPCSQRETFRLWESLGTWLRYASAPELGPNPLQDNVPHPGASFCEYVYASAEVDLVPGASTSHTCPELIWASVRHWQNTIDTPGSTLHAHVLIRDEYGQPLDPLPMTIKG